VKKCPECGNPSYDGAPVCGNCGYKFPKPKVAARREESIFQETQKEKKSSDDESIVDILKEKKLIIGIILIITFIVICGIIITGSNNGNNSISPMQAGDLVKYEQDGFSFSYPNSWQKINATDEDIEGAIFFADANNTTIEYYNISSDASSLKEINQERISYAIQNGDAVELVETITLDGRNASNMIWENADGDYTRYVSMFTDGKLYVFKATGDSINSITSEGINSVINSADIA
ncbi:PsbP-related protein, partial [Methanobrevibacter sp.]|uniref:PsbP-related protein n=1 Tax=Methanobrevibacter sp. TaxID=66852 RepID=UPI003890D4E5